MQQYIPRADVEYRQAMVNYLVGRASRLSNFGPGSRIASLIEAIAITLARGDLDTKQGFDAEVVSGVYEVFGFPLLPGLKATGLLRLEHSGHTDPINYPIFTIDLFGQRFETVEPVILNPADSFIFVEARAIQPGVSGNIQPGAIDTLDGRGTISPQIEPGTRVWNPAKFSGGTQQETAESRAARFRDFINSLGRSTIRGIYNAVISIPGVAGAVVNQNINPISLLEEAGWVNVYVSDGTSSPPPSLLAEVEKVVVGDLSDPDYQGYAAAGVRTFVGPVDVKPISVSYQYVVREGSGDSDAAIGALIDAAGIGYVNSLPIGQDILFETLHGRMLTAH
ncbi:MAG: baseplate J/gp47 family protein, partial [Leptospiraceae bacterium]|nr:baseplate J/gp47 family protein [Leptospiraceae bacterium]